MAGFHLSTWWHGKPFSYRGASFPLKLKAGHPKRYFTYADIKGAHKESGLCICIMWHYIIWLLPTPRYARSFRTWGISIYINFQKKYPPKSFHVSSSLWLYTYTYGKLLKHAVLSTYKVHDQSLMEADNSIQHSILYIPTFLFQKYLGNYFSHSYSHPQYLYYSMHPKYSYFS